jgi:glycosyltransferase involved in cell wall biosynthesis
VNKTIKLVIFVKNIDGGTGTYIQQLKKLESLPSSTKINVYILALEYPLFRKIGISEITYFHREHSYPDYYGFSFIEFYKFLSCFFWYTRSLLSLKPDIVLSIDIHCSLIAAISKFFFYRHIPLVLTTHNNIQDVLKKKASPLLSKMLIKLISVCYNQATVNLTVSKGLAKSFKKNFYIRKKIQTIYHGIPFKSQPTPKKMPVSIVTIGRLTPQKDYYTVVKTFELVYKRYKNIHLFIVGDGPLKKPLIAFSRTLKSKKNIHFTGWVQHPDRILLKASIFILSSYREGFPYTILEAMSYGIPIIATDIPYGPSEALKKGKYGILIPSEDIGSMNKSLMRLLTSSSTYDRYQLASYEGSLVFSEEKMLNKYRKLFFKILAVKNLATEI